MSFVCSVCGATHDGLPALTFVNPDHWTMLSDEQKAQGKCDTDLCATPDGHYFVRCVLVIPINDGPERTLEYGVWSSLSEENFWRYVETFNDGNQSRLGAMFGWLSNEIPGDMQGSGNLRCNVHPQDDRQRPLLETQPSDHPLFLAQRDGISFERALHLYHSHGKRWIPILDS